MADLVEPPGALSEGITTPRDKLMKLDRARTAVEAELEVIMEELISPGVNGGPPIGIDTPLVDRVRVGGGWGGGWALRT